MAEEAEGFKQRSFKVPSPSLRKYKSSAKADVENGVEDNFAGRCGSEALRES